MSDRPTEAEARSEYLRERSKMDNPVWIKRIHRRDMFAFVSEFSVRTVLNYEEIMFLSQFHKHPPFFQSQRLPRRVLEVRDHIKESDLFSCSLDARYLFLICLPERIQVIIMGYASDIGTIGTERLKGSEIRRIRSKYHIAGIDHDPRAHIDSLLGRRCYLHPFHRHSITLCNSLTKLRNSLSRTILERLSLILVDDLGHRPADIFQRKGLG